MAPQAGLQLYTLRNVLAQDFTGTIRQVAAIGYAGVETAFFGGAISARKAAAQIAEVGLTIFSAHTALPLGGERDAVLRTAADQGCQRIVWHGWPRDPRYDTLDGILQLADIYNRANSVAIDNGLTFGIHNHWWECELVEGRYPYRVLLEHLDPRIFFEPDTYWAKTAGLDPAAFVAELGARAPLLHVKDGPATQDDPMTPLGTGIMDIGAVIRAGGEATEWVIVELDEVAGDLLAAVAQSYRYLTSNGLAQGKDGVTALERRGAD